MTGINKAILAVALLSVAACGMTSEELSACQDNHRRAVAFWTAAPPRNAVDVDNEIENLINSECVTITPAVLRQVLHDINRVGRR